MWPADGQQRDTRKRSYLQLVGDEHHGLMTQLLPDGVSKDVIGHMSVQGAERIVQEVDVAVAVQGSGQADSLTLTSTQVGPSLTHLVKQEDLQPQSATAALLPPTT